VRGGTRGNEKSTLEEKTERPRTLGIWSASGRGAVSRKLRDPELDSEGGQRNRSGASRRGDSAAPRRNKSGEDGRMPERKVQKETSKAE